MLAAALVATALAAKAQPFSSPVGCDDCINYWYYLDHGNNTDYNCESSTYDNHNGTDYSLRGGNQSIDDGNEVVAAAAGVVRTASDGNYDRCTQCGGSGCGTNTPGGGFSNYVVIDHGSYDTTYGHMRNGSIVVQVGDNVECGTVIGQIGSAGCSTGAHLHFQPRPAGGSYVNNPLDPYAGPCSPTEASMWAEQGPHRGLPGYTCDEQPPMPECPEDTFELWTCTASGDSRRRCIDGVDASEACDFGCSEMSEASDDVCALPPDEDGDGARADTDCDDTRADVHPGAFEGCGDGIDQDCNGSDAACEPSATSGTQATSTVAATTGGAPATVSGSASSVTASSATGAPTGAVVTGVASTGGTASSSVGSTAGAATTMPSNAASTTASAGSTTGGATTMTPSDTGIATTASGVPPQAIGSGCSCRLAPSSFGARRGLLLLGVLGIAFARRRRPGGSLEH
jgi:hypothetical protein